VHDARPQSAALDIVGYGDEDEADGAASTDNEAS